MNKGYNHDVEFDGIIDLDSAIHNDKKKVPYETTVLTLGILSICTSWLYGIIGLVLSIIALALHRTDKRLYESDKASYKLSFYNSNAGKICAIIGFSISALIVGVLLFIIYSYSNRIG